MPYRVERATYLRILSCTLVAGGYFSVGLVPLTLFLNPYMPADLGVLAHLGLYIVPTYTLAATLALTLIAYLLQPFFLGPLARRFLDPVLISYALLIDLAVLDLLFWLNAVYAPYLLSARQYGHLLKACMGITVAFAVALTAHGFQRLYPARRRVARWLLLGIALLLPWFLFDQRRQSHTPPRRHTIVLDVEAAGTQMTILAIDGLSLDLLRPLQAAGRLPNLSRLMTEGASGRLRSMRPTTTPMVWTTVATGKRPFRHRITDDFVFTFAGGEETFSVTPRYFFFRQMTRLGVLKASPTLSRDWKALAFWELLHRAGTTVGVVNWPITYPAPRVRHYVVSDYLVKPYFQFGTGLAQVVYPARLEPIALRHRVMPADIPAPLVDTFIPRTPDDEESTRHHRLRQILRVARARDLTTRALSVMFSTLQRPRVEVLRFEGLHWIEQFFLKYHQPEAFGDVSGEDLSRYGRVVSAYYEFVDGLVGERMKDLPPDGILMVVSASGIEPITARERLIRLWGDPLISGSATQEGVIILWGANIQSGASLDSATIADVTPTILYAQGLPTARDMDGEPIFEAFIDSYKAQTPVSTIQSYEAARIGPRREVRARTPFVPQPQPPAPTE